MSQGSEPIADWRVRELVDRMRRPRYRCGGGVAAALVLAQAAALVDLVRRASNRFLEPAFSEELGTSLSESIERALQQAERDRTALDRLLATLRDGAPSVPAPIVEEATAVPLRTADLGLELLDKIDRLAPSVPKFAASDLEAATALCRAAIRASLAMAKANLPLLAPDRARALADEIHTRLSRLGSNNY
ncbi:MAG: cyclodeaminase/cyclohydrolase family protein [Thermomicrobium sp.]|nr:cyclodeaminase/cyclohydrolase family protein [Thermomicrobium sp.]MDW8059041.1 cyclodeaminase/cyclohydrolase family protein [Thermomicrobium sp.]